MSRIISEPLLTPEQVKKCLNNSGYGKLVQKGFNMNIDTIIIHENRQPIILNKSAIVSIKKQAGSKQCTIRTVIDGLEYEPDESYAVVVKRFFS